MNLREHIFTWCIKLGDRWEKRGAGKRCLGAYLPMLKGLQKGSKTTLSPAIYVCRTIKQKSGNNNYLSGQPFWSNKKPHWCFFPIMTRTSFTEMCRGIPDSQPNAGASTPVKGPSPPDQTRSDGLQTRRRCVPAFIQQPSASSVPPSISLLNRSP